MLPIAMPSTPLSITNSGAWFTDFKRGTPAFLVNVIMTVKKWFHPISIGTADHRTVCQPGNFHGKLSAIFFEKNKDTKTVLVVGEDVPAAIDQRLTANAMIFTKRVPMSQLQPFLPVI
ncbi:MAG: hypothetical protein VX438_00875 [Planctomycetota bacterium]|nr:hypothetical protein [Planctomycetota bacterium]